MYSGVSFQRRPHVSLRSRYGSKSSGSAVREYAVMSSHSTATRLAPIPSNPFPFTAAPVVRLSVQRAFGAERLRTASDDTSRDCRVNGKRGCTAIDIRSEERRVGKECRYRWVTES